MMMILKKKKKRDEAFSCVTSWSMLLQVRVQLYSADMDLSKVFRLSFPVSVSFTLLCPETKTGNDLSLTAGIY